MKRFAITFVILSVFAILIAGIIAPDWVRDKVMGEKDAIKEIIVGEGPESGKEETCPKNTVCATIEAHTNDGVRALFEVVVPIKWFNKSSQNYPEIFVRQHIKIAVASLFSTDLIAKKISGEIEKIIGVHLSGADEAETSIELGKLELKSIYMDRNNIERDRALDKHRSLVRAAEAKAMEVELEAHRIMQRTILGAGSKRFPRSLTTPSEGISVEAFPDTLAEKQEEALEDESQ